MRSFARHCLTLLVVASGSLAGCASFDHSLVDMAVAHNQTLDRVERDGVPRDEMEVRIEVRRDAGSRDGLREALERRLKDELGVSVTVGLVEEGDLAEIANTQGREGKPRRLIDRRPAYQTKGSR